MKWYSLALMEGVGDLIEDSWKLAWEVARDRSEVDFSNAIFQKRGPRNHLTLYFSPAAHMLAEAFGALPCDRPSPPDLTLVAGDERAWQIHFGRVFARPAASDFVDTVPSEPADLTPESSLQ